ncbi:putative proline dehydrogenase [Helianthus annuus]|nr:putative proline dehydrogenase [Helianthus annuus]
MAMTTNARSVNLIRSLNSLFRFAQTTTLVNATTTILNIPHPPQPQQTTSDQVYDFVDTKRLFSSVNTCKLIRSMVNLSVASMEPVVDLGMWVMSSRLMEVGMVRKIVLGVIKHTVYEHFVAGADTGEVNRTVKKLWESRLRGMLDYGLEHAVDNESCDKNAQQVLKTVESTQFLTPSSVSYVVVKITAICPVSLLKRVSDLLRWEYKNPSSFLLQWKRKTLPIFAECSAFYHTL